jgi:plasmid stabilization system protein ParE
MAVIILPDAQKDLISLQEYALNKWSEADRLKAEDEIFDELVLVQELASVGILEYQNVFTSHHKLVCRRINADVYVSTPQRHTARTFQRF